MGAATATIICRTPDAHGRFHVFYDGGMTNWSIDRVRRHVREGGLLDELRTPLPPCDFDPEETP